jgi:signal transduction histidine kinase
MGLAALSVLIIEFRDRLVRAERTEREIRRSLENLAAANHSFVAHLEDVEAESEERERLRITRELHDSIGYTMTSVSMMMKAAKYLVREDPAKLIDFCDRTQELARATLTETRDILYKLRSVRRENRPPLPIFFGRLCSEFQEATGVLTEFNAGNLPRVLDEAVFSVLFRAVQVGLINALRHGRAQHVRVFFWVDDDAVSLTIWNDGHIPHDGAPAPEGIGIRGIRERAADLGGSIRLGPVPGGFELVVRINVQDEVE